MKTINRLGIWMDHASANLFDPSKDGTALKTIVSTFTHADKEESLKRSEQLMHNKEQHEQAAYYKEIGEEIKQYDEVILFGPTTAKAELMNILNEDHHFNHIKITCKQAGKLTNHEQQVYVMEYFAL
jgi:stalled ribosome rescue protein Dom34